MEVVKDLPEHNPQVVAYILSFLPLHQINKVDESGDIKRHWNQSIPRYWMEVVTMAMHYQLYPSSENPSVTQRCQQKVATSGSKQTLS